MYEPGRRLEGFTDSLTQIIGAAAQGYKTATQPNYSPFSLAPYQGPNIDPRTGAYVPPPNYFPTTASNYTVPLLIGGGLLLLMMTRKGSKA